MKPENLTRINREIDGEDYDLNALVDYVIDRRADGQPSENIYTKRLRKQRDVAVSISARSIFFDRADDHAKSAAAIHASGQAHHRDRKRRPRADERSARSRRRRLFDQRFY